MNDAERVNCKRKWDEGEPLISLDMLPSRTLNHIAEHLFGLHGSTNYLTWPTRPFNMAARDAANCACVSKALLTHIGRPLIDNALASLGLKNAPWHPNSDKYGSNFALVDIENCKAARMLQHLTTKQCWLWPWIKTAQRRVDDAASPQSGNVLIEERIWDLLCKLPLDYCMFMKAGEDIEKALGRIIEENGELRSVELRLVVEARLVHMLACTEMDEPPSKPWYSKVEKFSGVTFE